MARIGRKENGQGSVKKLANGKIQCSIETQDANGKRKIITATAKKETEARQKAQDKLKQYKAFLMSGNSDKSLATQTLKEAMGGKWFDDYSKNKWTSKTKISRANDLAILYNAIGSVRLDKITTKVMNDFFDNALTPTNRQRLGMVYSITNAFFDDMYREGIIAVDVFGRGMKKLPAPRKAIKEEYTLEEIEEANFEDSNIKFFKDDEIIKLRDALAFIDANGKPLHPRAPIYYLMFLCGMRGQEVRALTLDDIDFEKHTIRINKALSTAIDKSGKEITILKAPKTSNSKRIIKINWEAEALLRRIIAERRCKDEKCKILYCTSSGNWVSKDNFARDFRNLLRKLDIEPDGRGPHCLRHTFASFALEKNELSPLKNETPLVISSYLGHANLDITLRIYTHLDKNKLKNIEYDDPFPKVIDIDFD